MIAALCVTLAWRPSEAVAAPGDAGFLERVLASLTPDERIGQLIMVDFVNSDVGSESDVAQLITQFKVGSVHITTNNGNIVNRGDTPGQVAALTNGLQQRALEATQRSDAGTAYFLPLLVAADNEGDGFPFTNLTNGYTQLPNNMTIGATWSKQRASDAGAVVGRELSAAGINMLLGPVVDVLDNPRSGGRGDIGTRSFGGNPTWVGELGRAFVAGVHEGSGGKMVTVAKHFPGHGGSDRSTDDEVPTVNKSLDQLRTSELVPFADVVRADANNAAGMTDAMMVSHIRYRNFLPGGQAPFTRPISLDATAFTALMQLPEFAAWRADHLVMSDSLGVPAIRKWYADNEGAPEFPNRTIVRDALLAGNDLLPLGEFYADPAQRGWRDYQLPVIEDSILYMREQYTSNPDFRRRADDAVRRVLATKLRLYPRLSPDEVMADPEKARAAAGSGGEAMRALAEDAVSLIEPGTIDQLRERVPRGPASPEKVLIVECWDDCYAIPVMPKGDLGRQLLAMYGPAGEGRLKPEDVRTISYAELDAWLAQPKDPSTAATASAIAESSWVIVALADYNPDARPVSGAAKRLLVNAQADLRNKSVIAVSYTSPYHLDSTEVSKLTAYFAVYSKTDDAIAAGFKALFGELTPRGRSPVNVGGIFYSVADAVQPDPSQTLSVSVFGQDPGNVADGKVVGLTAGPVLDRNGNPVPDGTRVVFSLVKGAATAVTTTGTTVDGVAGVAAALSGTGGYTATASVAGITSEPLSLEVAGGAPPPAPAETPASDDSGGGIGAPLLAVIVGVPAGVVAIGAAGAGVFVLRRRRRAAAASPAATAVAAASNGAAPAQAVVEEAPAPPNLRIDMDTRRVYVNGTEARPGLSHEQFRLLSYLYERAGKVVSREDLVLHVWPDAHAEGVSEEALDALVRRVRERIVQAGGERSYIVTLRGQGFRLEV